MKRLGEDLHVNSVFKRPFNSSRGESYGQSQVPGVGSDGGGGSVVVGDGGRAVGGDAQKLTTNDALTYLKEVKEMFQDQREKYDMFLDVMKEFKAQRIDTTGVIARVKELFKGHNNLIFGFNTFLPKGYEITDVEEEEEVEKNPPKRAVEFEEAIGFVNKIKKRFQNEDHVYKSFLDILNMYRKEHKGITDVYHEVSSLFANQLDLLDEFTRFLPETPAAISAPHVSFGRPSIHYYDERSSVITVPHQALIDKQRQNGRIINSHEQDRTVVRNHYHDDKTMLQRDPKKRAEKESKERRNHGQDYKETEHNSNRDFSMQRNQDQNKTTIKFEDAGTSFVMTSCDDKNALKSTYKEEFIFFEKVKERLGSSEDYQAFLKCLHIYSTEIITKKDLQSLVSDLLGKYPDLMNGFNEFLQRRENIDGFLSDVMNKKSLWNDGNSSKSVEIEDKEKEQKRDIMEQKEKEIHKEKYFGKSIQELDLTSCQRCTPSYRLLPDDYMIPVTSYRTELDAQVLNDHWISVTSGSEDYSFKHMRRNQYEESLFRCEDDRFELDMLLELVSSTSKRAEELLNRLTNNSISLESPMRVEEYFTVLNLRCIERIYGEHGLDVLEILKKKPSVSLPVILTRLKQKQEEWTNFRCDSNRIWAEIYSKNHHKSLDHRSFYFKQQDSKNLSSKMLVAEIKEIKEKTQKVDDVALTISTGSRYLVIPNLEYEYADADIHEDLYKLVKYSCEEVCSTKEQLSKVMKLWTTFFEPMLGVMSRSNVMEGAEDVAMETHAVIASKPAVEASLLNLKQIKPDSNESESIFPLPATPCKTTIENGDAPRKQEGYGQKEQNIATISDKLADLVVSAGLSERLTNSNISLAVGFDKNCEIISSDMMAVEAPCLHNENIVEDKPKGKSDVLYEDVIQTRAVTLDNGECKNVNRYVKDTEKEEGELSPNGDLEENNFVYGEHETSSKNKNAENGDAIFCPENDVDADEDSENVSQGDDISGNESAADECSHEEEEEDVAKVESEGEAEGGLMPDVHFGVVDSISQPMMDNLLRAVKPLSKHVVLTDKERKDSCVFFGNDSFYVLFRLHQVLYERLLSAKMNSVAAEAKWKTSNSSSPNLYGRFMGSLYGLLDGSSDNAKFEDDCRAIIGNQSYVLFTLDKVIFKLVKQLQTVATEETDNKLLLLHEYEKSKMHGQYVDSVYFDNVHVILHQENIYRFECPRAGKRLSIQLMDDGSDKADVVAVSVDPSFSNYLVNGFLFSSKKEPSGIYLQRNKRKSLADETSDICNAMLSVYVLNGLECKMACNSSKISYVLDTEDCLYQTKRRRYLSKSMQNQKRVKRFHKILSTS